MIELVNPMITVLVISITVSLILSLIYKFLTDQKELKKLNEDIKEMNSELKEAQKNKNQKELMKLQSKMMELNSKKMKSSMKPMMLSFIVIIPIFVFLLPSLYGDLNVELDESLSGTIEFDGTQKNVRIMEEDPIKIKIDGEEITKEEAFELKNEEFLFKDYDDGKKTVSFKRVIIELPFSMPIWGSKIGWLGWYILVSLSMTTIFRKALGVVQ